MYNVSNFSNKHWLTDSKKEFLTKVLQGMAVFILASSEEERYHKLRNIIAKGWYDEQEQEWLNKMKGHWHMVYILKNKKKFQRQ
jgi:hypothetical protein